MREPKPNLRWWLWGLLAFVIVIALSMAVTHPESVTLGIAEHQAAGSAARVDEIQDQWREGGVRTLAIVAMLGDLVFIGIYGWGSWLAGRSFMAMRGSARMLGILIAISAIIFLVTDYTETILQVVQLLSEQGSDWMAAVAATVRPVKILAWIATFGGVLMALAIRRFGAPAA
ncbi:hypothetical protein [Erythrobacter sp.]|uniref:hypothetical protein n=1 Tax=Erythrobacter sp. TaxID=1042 RepID=UPI001AFF3CD0|nr:hypothetical protein [Erythrobacter sp.]MBO6526275.1 hypothetical protein [Erythrobacter sp.]MBO6530528.1 hypothetical protein [Erythrobacter sp.]